MKIASYQTRLALTLALISAELSWALLWALTGAHFAGVVAPSLGLGATP